MSGTVAKFGYLLRLAARELVEEWSVSLAIGLAITSVAAPVLVLMALYTGVVSDIFGQLRRDPAVREIRLAATGAARFDEDWFQAVAGWDGVAFVAPSTRYASAQGQAFDASGRHEARATLLPTGAGDPVFPPAGLVLSAPSAAGLSASLAAALHVEAGDTMALEVTRHASGGGIERALVPLKVEQVAGAAAFGRDALFVHNALLVEIEDYKNGHRAPLLEVDGTAPSPRAYYPDFRLYATDITDVAPLAARLGDEPYRLTVRTDEARIAFAQTMDRSLTLVVGAVGLLGVCGLAGGLATIQWSMAARRRRTVAVLSLIGFSRGALIALPVLQAIMLAVLGAAATIAAAFVFTLLLDELLVESLRISGSRLGFGAVGLVSGLILAVSVLPAFWIGYSYSTLEPSNEIREI